LIRKCEDKDFEALYEIINDAAQAYQGIIPADRRHEPYMTKEELRREIRQGVEFWGYEEKGLFPSQAQVVPIEQLQKRRSEKVNG